MIINSQYYWGFQSRFSAMAIILSMHMIYSTMEGIVPSRCRLTTRHLGATLFKLRLHQICKSHVAASMHHDTWGLMQSHFYLPYWRPNSSHHNEPALGGYQLLLSTVQGTQVLIHYIEGCIAQLVNHKALNLVDVGSSPTMEATLWDVIEVYIKSRFSIFLLSRPLGATLVEVFWASGNYKSQVAASMTTRHLGATYMEYSVYE